MHFPRIPLPTHHTELMVETVPASPSAWGHMAQFPGITSHESGLHLRAGCQYWKLLHVSGSQPPFSKAVVVTHVYLIAEKIHCCLLLL